MSNDDRGILSRVRNTGAGLPAQPGNAPQNAPAAPVRGPRWPYRDDAPPVRTPTMGRGSTYPEAPAEAPPETPAPAPPAKRSPGRPPKAGEVRNINLSFQVTPSERAAILQHIADNPQIETLSAFLRECIFAKIPAAREARLSASQALALEEHRAVEKAREAATRRAARKAKAT